MAKSEEVPCVELTPHNRSKCQSKACHETLKKGELRIGNSTKKNWWHINCVPEKQKSRVESAEELEGFSDLSSSDQKKLQKEWSNGGAPSKRSEEESSDSEKSGSKRKRNQKTTEKEGKRKRKKKAKATDGTEKVKRGRTAYIYFCNDKRAELTKERPELKAKELLTALGALWSKLSDDDKKPYLLLQQEDKQRYTEEMQIAKEKAKNNNNNNNNNADQSNGDDEEEAEEEEEEVEEEEAEDDE